MDRDTEDFTVEDVLEPSKQQLAEAAKIIAQIGTTGAESTDTIRSARDWLKRNGFENYL